MMSRLPKMHLVLCLVCLLVWPLVPSTVLAAQDDAVQVETAQQGAEDVFTYSPMGRRDPFKPLIEKKQPIAKTVNKRPEKVKGPLERFELNQFRLMAIMIVKGAPRAMVKAPDGKSYTVKVDDYIGMNDGQVKNIETKVIDIDENGMRVEKSPDRIVVEELGIDSLSGKEIKENRYIVM